MHQQAPHTGIAPDPAPEPRISTLLADRPCSTCCFNLVGQSIVRERHYAMLIVRCPECGTVASLQEYPLLGRWANRWAALAAALWFLLATALTFGIAGIIFGFTMGTMQTTVQPLATLISKKHDEHQMSTGVAANQYNSWYITDTAWWDTVDKAALIKEAGGWSGAIQWWGLLIWVIAFSILVPLSAAWSIAAAHRRGWKLLLTFLPILLIAAAFWSSSNLVAGPYVSVHDLAGRTAAPVLLPICAALAILALLIGALFGRPLARCMVTLWLPPRLRVPLSFLWICDGKNPPKPTW